MTAFASGGVLRKGCHRTLPQSREAAEKVRQRVIDGLTYFTNGTEPLSCLSIEEMADLIVRVRWLRDTWMRGWRGSVTDEELQRAIEVAQRQLQYSVASPFSDHRPDGDMVKPAPWETN